MRIVVLAWTLLAVATLSGAANKGVVPGAEGFYIHRSHFSDAMSEYGGHYPWLLDVTQRGEDVRVRMIRFGWSWVGCEGQAIEAQERTLRHTTVDAIAGVSLCGIARKQFDSAIDRVTNRKMGLWEGTRDTAVVFCDGRQAVLPFPVKSTIDWKSLDRRHRDAASLGQLLDRVRAEIFGGWPTPNNDGVDRRALDATGIAVAPDLASDRFAAIFNPEFRRVLAKYNGPQREPEFLIEPVGLKFAAYVQPEIPPIARSARVWTGDVVLRLSVERATGAVTAVETLSGPPLLAPGAAAAAKRWRLQPDSIAADQMDVTVHFAGMRCRP